MPDDVKMAQGDIFARHRDPQFLFFYKYATTFQNLSWILPSDLSWQLLLIQLSLEIMVEQFLPFKTQLPVFSIYIFKKKLYENNFSHGNM